MKKIEGIVHVILTYISLWIPLILEKITGLFNKDLFFILEILAVLIMVDARMKYENKLVKINLEIILGIFILTILMLFFV